MSVQQKTRLTLLAKQSLQIAAVYLVLLTCYRFLFFFYFKEGEHEGLISCFLLGLRFDIRWAFIPALIYAILASFKWMNPAVNRKAKVFWLVLNIIISFLFVCILCLDFGYYDYLKTPLDAYILELMKNTHESWGMVWQSYPVIWGGLLIVIFLFLLGKIFNAILSQKIHAKGSKTKRILGFCLLFLVLAFGIFGQLGQYPLRWSVAFQGRSLFIAHVTLPPFETLYNTLKFTEKKPYDEEVVRQGYTRIAEYLNIDNPDIKTLNFKRTHLPDSAGTQENFNVVLIIAESLSAHQNSSYFQPIKSTPYLDKIIQEAVLYDRCFVPSKGTAHGIFSTIVGIPDFELNKTASRNPLLVEQNVLIDQLEGYRRYYFIGGSLSWANVRGFLNFNINDLQTFEENDFKSSRADIWGVGDRELLQEANSVLAKEKEPFFAVIQLASNHEPYTITERDYAAGFKGITMSDDSLKLLGFKSNAQLNGCRYMDFSLGLYMDAVRKESYFHNTLFVIVGDHGLSSSHAYGFPEIWTTCQLTDFHTPLIYYCPALLEPKRISTLASQADVIPTALGIINKTYVNTGMGRDLSEVSDAAPCFVKGAGVGGHFCGVLMDSVYVEVPMNMLEATTIYDYSTPRLPQERLDLLKDSLQTIAIEYFNTARYLIRNNKKQK